MADPTRVARSNHRACAYQAATACFGDEGSMRKASRTTSTAEQPPVGGSATPKTVQDTQKVGGAAPMGLKSKLPEMMTIITMLDKAFDLERQAEAHGNDDEVVDAMQYMRKKLSHRLRNTTSIACHEHEPVGWVASLLSPASNSTRLLSR